MPPPTPLPVLCLGISEASPFTRPVAYPIQFYWALVSPPFCTHPSITLPLHEMRMLYLAMPYLLLFYHILSPTRPTLSYTPRDFYLLPSLATLYPTPLFTFCHPTPRITYLALLLRPGFKYMGVRTVWVDIRGDIRKVAGRPADPSSSSSRVSLPVVADEDDPQM